MTTASSENTRVRARFPLYQIILLAWLVPGAGHLLLGKVWKSLLFFLSLTSIFIGGLLMKGIIFVPGGEDTQTFFISLFGTVADLGLVLYYILCLLFYPIQGEITYRFYETGMLYTLVAGVFNYLIMVDALDIYRGRKK
ncbi:hypothetical protein JXQ70_12655 [bacterium]|nr:hypothetical protein [bacterium]